MTDRDDVTYKWKFLCKKYLLFIFTAGSVQIKTCKCFALHVDLYTAAKIYTKKKKKKTSKKKKQQQQQSAKKVQNWQCMKIPCTKIAIITLTQL